MYSINSDGIDRYLWDVRVETIKSLGVDRGNNAVHPLAYYISTGRASVEFLHKLIAVSPVTIARILLDGGSDVQIMSRIKRRISFKESGL